MQTNSNNPSNKLYNLEERTLAFTKTIIKTCKNIPQTTLTENILRQLLRSSSSIGANYREANDALGKKDFFMKIKTSRKEAKETLYWLNCLEEFSTNKSLVKLQNECKELISIFSAIAKHQ